MMKLVMAIVSSEDSRSLLNQLSDGGFSVTVNSSTGGFLRNSSTTIFCGVEESEVEAVLSIIRNSCPAPSAHKQLPAAKSGLATSVSAPANSAGRTTIFVLDVDHFEQV